MTRRWRSQRTHPTFRTMDCSECYEKHGPMLALLDTYDWRMAFSFADDFTREDVVAIIAHDDGEQDESDWLGLFVLRNGRFAALSAGCDYTGWD